MGQALLIIVRAQYRPVALETELAARGQAAERMIAMPECPERMEINIFLMIHRLDSQAVAVVVEVLATLTHQHSLRAMWAVLQMGGKAVQPIPPEDTYLAHQENQWEVAAVAELCRDTVIMVALAVYISASIFKGV